MFRKVLTESKQQGQEVSWEHMFRILPFMHTDVNDESGKEGMMCPRKSETETTIKEQPETEEEGIITGPENSPHAPIMVLEEVTPKVTELLNSEKPNLDH